MIEVGLHQGWFVTFGCNKIVFFAMGTLFADEGNVLEPFGQ
jgi:hypothetical protein